MATLCVWEQGGLQPPVVLCTASAYHQASRVVAAIEHDMKFAKRGIFHGIVVIDISNLLFCNVFFSLNDD